LEEERDGEAASARKREAHEAKLAALRAALIEGEQSGPSMPFDF
jgi:Bacterial antitoxin of ParD toxin-antitoxin type II system and RHH